MKKLCSYFLILMLWLLASIKVNSAVLLPSPMAVGSKMFLLLKTPEFYSHLASSLGRIGLVVLLGFLLSLVLVILSLKSEFIKQFVTALNDVVRTIPVAAFIILSLIWIGREGSIILVGMLIILPLIYDFLMESISGIFERYESVLEIYGSSFFENLFKVYLPLMKSPLLTLFKSSTLLAVKTTINAEVLVAMMQGIGYQLIYAQSNLDTTTVLAYSGWIVLLSLLFSHLISWWSTRNNRQNEL